MAEIDVVVLDDDNIASPEELAPAPVLPIQAGEVSAPSASINVGSSPHASQHGDSVTMGANISQLVEPQGGVTSGQPQAQLQQVTSPPPAARMASPPTVLATPPPLPSPLVGDSGIPLSRHASTSGAQSPQFKRSKVSTSSAASADDSDDEAEDPALCTICFETWTSSGPHRLVSLRCGHLFGKSCIEQWLRGSIKQCPICNSKAALKDVRPIYAKLIAMVDTSERDMALEEAKKEREARVAAEQREAEFVTRATEKDVEIRRLKEELERIKQSSSLLTSSHVITKSTRDTADSASMASAFSTSISAAAAAQSIPSLDSAASASLSFTPSRARRFERVHLIALPHKTNRCLDYSNTEQVLLASGHSPATSPFFPQGAHGLIKISAADPRHTDFIATNTAEIRDIRASPNSSLVLTASPDKTLKVISLESNTVCQRFNLPDTAWTCCWNKDNPVYVFAGLRNNNVLAYDLRHTQSPVYEMEAPSSFPLVSIHHMRVSSGNQAIVGGHLKGVCSWVTKEESTSTDPDWSSTTFHDVPALAGPCTWIAHEPQSCEYLASFRPTKSRRFTMHSVCDFTLNGAGVVCHVSKQLLGGPKQQKLTKSHLMRRPGAPGLLSCIPNETNHSLQLFDVSSGNIVQTLKRERGTNPFLDVASFTNDTTTVLAGVAEGMVELFRYQ
eukprot:m.210185 g.210185  ORF g.210185 m.210185 type:complete len:674 (+) comp15049_c0_seq2:1263-3284(+)